MGDFARPRDGFRFAFGGMKTNARPDVLPPNRYPIAVNVRSYEEGAIRTRPGLTRLFTMGTSFSTDVRAYTALQTDDLPRILTRNQDDSIWLDTGVQVGTLAGAGATFGASMIPFRPSDSPTLFMYVANGKDYQKFSAPTATNAVTQQKVGIAEPQIPPDASIGIPIVSFLTNSPPYTPGGTAGTVTPGTRISDTSIATFIDGTSPVSFWEVNQVSPNVQYQRGMEVDMGLANTPTLVEDVFPPLATPLTVAAIFYFSGNTGRCSVVLTGGTSAGAGAPSLGPGAGGGSGGGVGPGGPRNPPGPLPLATNIGTTRNPTPGTIGVGPGGPPRGRTGRSGAGTVSNIYNVGPLPQLRRGSLLTFNGGGGETVMVLSVTEGPVGSICFETITVNNHVAGETVTGKPGILLLGSFGASIVSKQVSFAVTMGIGTVTGPIPATFFAPGGFAFSPDDYLHFSVNIDNLQNLIELKIMFDVGDGSFTQNYFYYSVRPSDIAAAAADAQSQLAALQTAEQRALIDAIDATFGANLGTTPSSGQTSPGSSQWSEIYIPLIALTRIGDDQTKTLQNAASIRFEFNTSATVNAQIGSVNVSGGSQPDTGDIGAPYRYRFRGRSSVTGAVSNPSPTMRYGVTARRRAVNLLIQGLGTPYDPQIDTWDFFRYGGSVTEWRYVGSAPINPLSANVAFVDNVPDEAAQAGNALDFDNFEPWPTILQPVNMALSSPRLVGNVFVGPVTDVATGAAIPSGLVLRILPGTLFRFPTQSNLATGNPATTVLTLRTRPVQVSPGIYRFEFEENGGVTTPTTIAQVSEPILANQPLPYMWGPDVNGTVFAVGDPLRPGTLYFAKNNVPDSAPDSNDIEITPPSEPLLGGEVVDGLSFVGSTERWWALYPQPDNPAERYNFVQQPVERGIAAPFGHCNNGKEIFYWAKDGIWRTGGGGKSLTDDDLYNLFPHEGVEGANYTYNGVTIQAPNYQQVMTFRLTYANGFLYATYTGLDGQFHQLILNLKTMAWNYDSYADQISIVYKVEQQVESSGALNPVILFAGKTTKAVYQQTDLTNDFGTPITCSLAVREFDGGDVRAPKQWGDLFLDLIPAAQGLTAGMTSPGVDAVPMSLGVQAALSTLIAPSSTRSRVPLSAGGIAVSDFLGLFITWADDFTKQSVPTQLFVWQPSFDIQPAKTIQWETFGTSFGMQGFGHIRQIAIAWVSTAPVTLTIITFDGQPPQALMIPSSGGVYKKQLFPLTANKGQLFTFAASSAAPFQIFEEDIEIHVGAWAREGPYQIFKSFGGSERAQSPI